MLSKFDFKVGESGHEESTEQDLKAIVGEDRQMVWMDWV